jgi:hypothetical protein
MTRLSTKIISLLLRLALLCLWATAAFAQFERPGEAVSEKSEMSDQKTGSVLVYNLYSSKTTDPTAENTRLSLTNTSGEEGVFVNLFFLNGTSPGTYQLHSVRLEPRHTVTLFASEIDPDVTGYVIAVAVAETGVPVNFNHLTGEAFVKLASGHQAKYNAEAIAAIKKKFRADGAVARLNFDGKDFNLVPRSLSFANIPSLLDGYAILVVINRLGHDLTAGVGGRTIIGQLFDMKGDDHSGQPFPFIVSGLSTQLRMRFSSSLPRIVGGGLNGRIPAGKTGWMQFWVGGADVGISGLALIAHPGGSTTSTVPVGFTGGANLHHATLTEDFMTIPVTPPVIITE